tara:strand:- start:3793 stop:4704 length:912 start_codon:yes stop_codon:yes gene_type:complete
MLLGVGMIPLQIYAQETPIGIEESAEVFLEDYSDDFQENFFEALKQKGIENYDRAIKFYLACKQLEPDNTVIDHELAKVYFEDKQFPLAEQYAISALATEPGNLWYLATLVEILEQQGRRIESFASGIDLGDIDLMENLAMIYYKRGRYNDALKVLQDIGNSSFSKELTLKISDSLQKRKAEEVTPIVSVTKENGSEPNNQKQYMDSISALIATDNLPKLEQLSEDALERFPSQPYFYYANGYALNHSAQYSAAIEVLEAALDYLLDDVSLANKIYKELSDAYAANQNIIKSNMYLRKIKPGF